MSNQADARRRAEREAKAAEQKLKDARQAEQDAKKNSGGAISRAIFG